MKLFAFLMIFIQFNMTAWAIQTPAQLVAEFKRVGVIQNIDCPNYEVWMNPVAWNMWDYKTKENVTLVFGSYCSGNPRKATLIKVRDKMTGKELSGVDWLGMVYVK